MYTALLNVENCINTVFSEEGYFFLRERIEETLNHFNRHGLKVSLEKVNKFLAEEIWPGLNIEGIIYDDKPHNPQKDRMYSEIPNLYYKKRIQVVIFDLKNIRNFELYLEEQS